ncbi:MAG: magnesium transporter [Caldilineaceae bacterium SB0670_bin_27]|nr:magnesium transporter [Caldilineaceae bacterium SB0670_bin_27]
MDSEFTFSPSTAEAVPPALAMRPPRLRLGEKLVPPVASDSPSERVRFLLHRGETVSVIEILMRLHSADSSEILCRIDPGAQHAVLQELPWEEVADVLEELDKEELVEVVQGLTFAELADVLDEMEPDMGADLIGELEDEAAAELLGEMGASAGVEPLLDNPEDSAVEIKNSPCLVLNGDKSVGQATAYLRRHYDYVHDLYDLYVLDGGAIGPFECGPGWGGMSWSHLAMN